MKLQQKITIAFIVAFSLISLASSCKAEKSPITLLAVSTSESTVFAGGADVSWVTQMEANGKKFYNSAGNEMECMALLKSLGMNSIRLRVWVNPSDGWCNAQETLTKAIRAKNLGMRIMIDFHYSDVWADPSNQTKPVEWVSLSLADLKMAVATHTTDVLNLLKTNGITPEWVQVGNETGNGMLWEDGKASNSMANYAALTNVGYDAVKAVFPTAKVVVHLQNGYSNSLFRWIFDGLKTYGGKYDVIGMSLYPSWYTTSNDWQNCNKDCLANMNDMVSRYGKEVMIVECGMSWDTPTVCKNFLVDLITKTKSVTGGKGIGVFYWEPECYPNWNNYTLGAFDNSGKPTAALDAFSSNTGILMPNIDKPLTVNWNNQNQSFILNETIKDASLYTVNGEMINVIQNNNTISATSLPKGIYLVKVNTANNYPSQILKALKY
ncbi:MAG: glycosyl hydrolase 53 family protein [Paludibacter sp.]